MSGAEGSHPHTCATMVAAYSSDLGERVLGSLDHYTGGVPTQGSSGLTLQQLLVHTEQGIDDSPHRTVNEGIERDYTEENRGSLDSVQQATQASGC